MCSMHTRDRRNVITSNQTVACSTFDLVALNNIVPIGAHFDIKILI